MLGMLGGLSGFIADECCQRKVRVIYVPNLPLHLHGKEFSSEEELMLVTNIRPSDYQSEIACK